MFNIKTTNMKTKIILALFVVMATVTSAFAENKTESFKANGACGMCKTRIENAAKSVAGVSSATWDSKTQMVSVTFDTSKTDLKKINQAIADAGHDTDMCKAKDETYNALPGCCHYERSDKKAMTCKKGTCCDKK